jgi:Flp pilus assembly protein TadG
VLNLAKKFVGNDERGSVAIIFALMLLPLLGMVGAAVDYSRLALRKTNLQSIAHSAALAGASAMMKKADQMASIQEAAGTAAATAIAAQHQAPLGLC